MFSLLATENGAEAVAQGGEAVAQGGEAMAQGGEAMAQGGDAAAQGNGLMGMLPIFIVIIVFMFFMSRSQRKQQQKRQEMLDALVKGTQVVLAGGIRGRISEVKAETFMVEIAPSVVIEVAKNGVAEAAAAEKQNNAEAASKAVKAEAKNNE